MITASPRDDNSFAIAQNSGFDASTPESTARSYEEYVQEKKNFPHQDDILVRRAALKDPVLAAIFFDEFSCFFFEKIVGWNKREGKSIEGGGLFGEVVACAAGVDTQGGGTLHFHALLFLKDFPATFEEEKIWRAVASQKPDVPQYEDEYCAYTDSISSAIYPIYQFFMIETSDANESASKVTAFQWAKTMAQIDQTTFFARSLATATLFPVARSKNGTESQHFHHCHYHLQTFFPDHPRGTGFSN
jgi:hypothetical protein